MRKCRRVMTHEIPVLISGRGCILLMWLGLLILLVLLNLLNSRSDSLQNPNMEQFIAAQMQILQGLTAAVQQLQQNQQNQQPQQQQYAPPARDKHRDFMSHHPPTFSHAVDPLDADDWLKVIGKKLDITQCNDREKVLYASGRLEGAASDWWDAFTAAHPNADTITWQEFLLLQLHDS